MKLKEMEENFKMYTISYTHGTNRVHDTYNISAKNVDSALNQFKDYINKKFLSYTRTADFMIYNVVQK